MDHHYEKLDVWKRSCQLAVDVYRAFKGVHDPVFRDQMIRASLSIPSNIAEGCERKSDKEFLRFLNIAVGSAAELRTQALICTKADILPKPTAQHIARESNEIAAMHRGLQKTLQSPPHDF